MVITIIIMVITIVLLGVINGNNDSTPGGN